jgi:hypothetical protein
MSRELEFDGWWEGEIVYTCDSCHKEIHYPFTSEEEAKSYAEKADLKKKGWLFTKVGGRFIDTCCEACRNKYIRMNTI